MRAAKALRRNRAVVGHSRAWVALDSYSHVLTDEPPELLRERAARAGGHSVPTEPIRETPRTVTGPGFPGEVEPYGALSNRPLAPPSQHRRAPIERTGQAVVVPRNTRAVPDPPVREIVSGPRAVSQSNR